MGIIFIGEKYMWIICDSNNNIQDMRNDIKEALKIFLRRYYRPASEESWYVCKFDPNYCYDYDRIAYKGDKTSPTFTLEEDDNGDFRIIKHVYSEEKRERLPEYPSDFKHKKDKIPFYLQRFLNIYLVEGGPRHGEEAGYQIWNDTEREEVLSSEHDFIEIKDNMIRKVPNVEIPQELIINFYNQTIQKDKKKREQILRKEVKIFERICWRHLD